MPEDLAITLSNPAKERMKAGEVALGMVLKICRTAEIARIAKTSGFDFLFIDTQHAAFSLETINTLVHAALGCGITPMVRVRGVHDPDVSLLLDSGVTGIVFPDVDTAEDARLAVSRCKFPPVGKRSVASGYAIFDYRPIPLKQSVPLMNENTLVVCMIETREGVRNADAIAAVEGVDVLLVGTNDLLSDMGKPGAFGDAEATAAVEHVVDAALRHGKFAGAGGDRDPERQARLIRRGVRFMPTQSDAALLMEAGRGLAGRLREASRRGAEG
jgi:2-keto-3-deoxy-L-rhamnonate aldolase RhmA